MVRTIRTRLFVSFLAAFLVVLALLSTVLLFGLPGHPEYGGLPRERQQVTANLTIEADSRQDRVMRWLEERRGSIHVLSHNAPVADDVAELRHAFTVLGPAGAAGGPGWRRLEATPSYQRVADLLNTLRQSYGDYHALAVVEAQTGRVIAADRPALLGVELAQDPAVREVLRTRADVTSPVHQSRLVDAPVVSFSGPIRDPAGQLIAVLVGECPLEDIASSVFAVGSELGQTGEAFLVNSDGTNLHRLKFPVTGSTSPAPLTYRIRTPQVKLALEGKNGVMESRDYRGKPVLVAYRYLPVTPQWGWAMIVKQDLAESYAAVRARVLFTLALVLCGLLAFGVLASVVSRRLSAPLVSLTRTAREVSAGNLAARTSVATRDEIGTLASTFNSLVAGVAERQESLERERGRMALLAGTAAQLLATDDSLGAVNGLCRRVMAFLDCQVFLNYLADEQVGRLHLNAYAGIPEEIARDIGWLDYGVAVCGCVAQEGGRIVAEHIPTTPDPRTELVKGFGVKAYACHPILSGEQVLGTLSFGTTTRETFTEDELALMKAVADQVAIAVVRQQTEQAVRESEARYRELVQNANSAIIRWSRDGTITFFNEYAQEFFGYREEEALGQHVGMLVPGADSAGGDMRVLVEAIVAHPEAFAHNVNENVRRDGSRVWMAWTNRPIFDAEGELAEVLAVGTDISARVQAEEALQRQAELLDLSYEAIFTWEFGGPILSWNRGAEQLYGYAREEAVGRVSHELLRTVFPELQQRVLAALVEGESWTGELVHTTQDGRTIVVESRLQLVEGESGQRVVLETNRDVTARREMEEALREARDELEVRVEARTGELARANLALQVEVAERTRAEQEVRAASLYARSLIEASLDPLVTVSPEGTITDVNEATIAATGVSREQLVGTDFSEYFTEPEEARRGYQEVFSRGFVTDYPLTIRHRDGRLMHVLYNAAVYRDGEGEVRGVFAAARDVTAQRQAAQYARSLIEASLDPLVTISPEGKITDVNQATIAVTGVPREGLIGTDFSDYFTEPEEARRGYRRVFSQGYVTDYALTIRHRDGRLMEVLYNATLYRDADGQVVGVFAAARDVTAQRQAAQYARSLIEASLDPLVTISPEGKITDVNAATVDATGISREQLIGTDFSDYFTAPEQARAGYQQVFARGFVIDYPLTIRHREGRLMDVLYSATVYHDVHGEALGVFAAARDVTERKRAEEEVRRLNQELEQRVIERTAQLGAAMAEMEAFTYSVSHDLRAPLRAMDGFSLALLDDHRSELTEEGMLYLNRIRGASQRMGQLIEDLLQLSRVTRGEMRRTRVDLSATARSIAAELQESDPGRPVAFVITDGLWAHGDARLLEQVLRNVLDNAWKFTSKHATARIEFGVREQEGELVFFVRDDGAGFNMAYADKLFRIFQRLHGMEEFEGTGIGLVTVSRIIQRHGGRVWAEGTPERGAAFYFTLPHRSQAPAQSGTEQRAWTPE